MKRRTLLLGAGAATAAAAGGLMLWRPVDRGAPHDAYFSALNEMLKAEGPGRPVLLLDLARMNRNIDLLAGSVGPEKTYRVVAKSLPSVELLGHVMDRAQTRAHHTAHKLKEKTSVRTLNKTNAPECYTGRVQKFWVVSGGALRI